MRFNRLDLNLLVALDALLTERSITRAAERLKLTPSAVSSALARLREYFDDELLVQVGRKMESTPRAEGLHEAVRDVLVRIDSTIAMQPQFDPANTDRTFRIFLSDYSQLVFAPHMLALAAEQHCSARFEFLPQVTNPQRSLERAEADLLIIPRGFLSPDHPEEVLYEEEFVCVVWRDGPLADGELSFERYLAAGHVVMQPAGAVGESFEAWFLKRYGVSRRVAVTTYGFAAMPALVCGTAYVATVHARLARAFVKAWPVAIKAPPLPIERMQQAVQWHKYRTQDPGLVWLRNLLRAAVQRMAD
ncbi:LysR family transcriptional regulator [Aquabacterium humicola]|uniref:LysR family transcriptional regulator n=1 Tax=Aquabacterium humicola TaxID=3237377 RepID=UPI002542B3EA|nr:LysR family transcriptional regulator [Rubrivivax pictus]